MKTNSLLDLPRFVTAEQGASLLGIELSRFHHWVSIGWLPSPLAEINKWDREALLAAVDRLSGIGDPGNALEAWRAGRRAG